MAIQDDFAIDYVNRRITYETAFVEDRPPFIYTVNELYSYLQDTFDEPEQMDDPIPMSAQTPTQYTLGRIQGSTGQPWFIDDESMKALYGGSIQTTGWTYATDEGITALRWQDAPSAAPEAGDIGITLTGTSTATGTLLAVDTTRQVVWVRNTNTTQFGLSDTVTGTGVSFVTMAETGFQTGESIWANLFSVGSLQTETEIYVGQEDDYLGGTAYHDADADSKFERRIEKIDEWWDSDVDFATGSPNLLGGAGHFDILVKVDDAGTQVDGRRLAVFARQFSKIYSHFELVGGVGNFVVPFASTGADLNSADGPYSANFQGRSGTDFAVGDVLENATGTTPVGRLRAVATAVTTGGSTTGSFEYYLIGENQPYTTTDRTLEQLANLEDFRTRGASTNEFEITGAASKVSGGPAESSSITVTFGDNQVDVTEDGTAEEYACTIDCSDELLATVYQRMMFLTCRGNQDGDTPDTQDKLLPSGHTSLNESGEFYRAVGDIIFNYDAEAGTGLTEGELVTNGTGAYGVVVSATEGATGVAVLTQVKGTFANDETISDIDDGVTNTVDIDGTPTSIVDNTAAPFGSFAGGRWFVAQGVVLTNVPTADVNNWETVDLDGTRILPPSRRSITFAGLAANDRAAIFEVDGISSVDVVKTVGVASGGFGASSIVLDGNVAQDVPATGWVRVVDTSLASAGTEYRMEYSSYSGTTVTLRDLSAYDGADSGAGTNTIIDATGAFSLFGADGQPKIGMIVRNVTDGTGVYSIVVRKIDVDSIEVTDNGASWAGDSFAFNELPTALDGTDTCYFPYIDDVSTGASIEKTIKYDAPTPIVARARFSDPDIGGQRILPFQQTGQQITDADLTITAIRTDDDIAS